MKSEDAMVVWMPNREPFMNDPNRGRVAVTTIPEHNNTRRFSHSAGSCDAGWEALSEGQRFERIKRLARQMIDEDNIQLQAIEAEFSKIDGWGGL